MRNTENTKKEGQIIHTPTAKEMANLHKKLQLSKAGHVVYLAPDEVETSDLHELSETGMTLQDALDSQFSIEELDEALKNAPDEYADKTILAEVANEMLLSVMGTINAKLYEIQKSAPEEAEHLRKMRREVKKIKDQIRTYNPDYSNKIREEWRPILTAKDNEKSLWEKINALLPKSEISEEEKEKRRKAIANANASFELEGGSISAEAKAQDERFINGKISRETWLKDEDQCYIGDEITTEEWFNGRRNNDLNDDVIVRRKFGVVANALLEKVIMFVTWQLQTIRKKTEVFFDLSDEDKKVFDKLNFMIGELERLQKKIPGQTQEENYALFIEWKKLLHADDAHQSLWERLEREGEKGRRRDAIESTNANFEWKANIAQKKLKSVQNTS